MVVFSFSKIRAVIPTLRLDSFS